MASASLLKLRHPLVTSECKKNIYGEKIYSSLVLWHPTKGYTAQTSVRQKHWFCLPRNWHSHAAEFSVIQILAWVPGAVPSPRLLKPLLMRVSPGNAECYTRSPVGSHPGWLGMAVCRRVACPEKISSLAAVFQDSSRDSGRPESTFCILLL